MFRKLYDASFQFEHCWNVLRNNPKWVDHRAKEKPKRRSAATPFASESIQLEEDDASQAAFVDLERPLDRKSEKARLSKRKSSDSLCANLEGILSDMQEQKKLKSNEKKKKFLKGHVLKLKNSFRLGKLRLTTLPLGTKSWKARKG
jgi:hypothetical protein